jgi:hypothetical protein
MPHENRATSIASLWNAGNFVTTAICCKTQKAVRDRRVTGQVLLDFLHVVTDL